MGRKGDFSSEDKTHRVRAKQRSKHDKAHRNFELHGKHTSKHLRIQASRCETRALQLKTEGGDTTASGGTAERNLRRRR